MTDGVIALARRDATWGYCVVPLARISLDWNGVIAFAPPLLNAKLNLTSDPRQTRPKTQDQKTDQTQSREDPDKMGLLRLPLRLESEQSGVIAFAPSPGIRCGVIALTPTHLTKIYSVIGRRGTRVPPPAGTTITLFHRVFLVRGTAAGGVLSRPPRG